MMKTKDEIEKALVYCRTHIENHNKRGIAPDTNVIFIVNILENLLRSLC